MIPIYSALEFVKVMEGGSTRPWQVTVLKDGNPVPYVVKLYTESNNDQNSTVLKECICSNLAKQFDFSTPEIALIEFGADFISSLSIELQSILKTKDQRIKFASRLVESPYENYSPQLHEKYIQSFDIAGIYAFDNLILNVDRRVEKPNMFFQENNVILIDHELSLATSKNALQNINSGDVWSHNYKRHLFFEILKKQDKLEKNSCFSTFSYYLSSIVNFNNLDSIYDQLNELHHPCGDFFDCKDYFRIAKQNQEKFVKLLEGGIQ